MAVEPKLRPQTLAEYIGQTKVCENLGVFLAAARARGEPLDHVLLTGPPGLGKTTLAYIIAREMSAGLRMTAGPMIARAGDLAGILTNLQPRDVLFVDEIHRLSPQVEEILYPAMEDYRLDILIGEGPMARTMKVDLPPFTLVGATTRPGLLSQPLHGRFGIALRLDFYDVDALAHDRDALGRHPRHSPSKRRRPARSADAAAAHPASPTASCGACAISPRSAASAPSTSRRPARL